VLYNPFQFAAPQEVFLRAFVFLFSLSVLFPALAFPAISDDVLVWKSGQPACYTIIRQSGIERRIPGFETYYRVDGSKSLFYRQCDFLQSPDALMSDIGMPLRYEDAVNTKGLTKPALHAKLLPNDHIKLY
jgi:hypothetical protein